jgi:hypothetical protein
LTRAPHFLLITFFLLHSRNLYYSRKTKYTAKNLEFWGNPNTLYKSGLKKKQRRQRKKVRIIRGVKERNRGSQFTWSTRILENEEVAALTRVFILDLPYAMQTAFSENLIDFDYFTELNVL